MGDCRRHRPLSMSHMCLWWAEFSFLQGFIFYTGLFSREITSEKDFIRPVPYFFSLFACHSRF